jgi:glycosyltransferase involved in cell wall biosynthesis
MGPGRVVTVLLVQSHYWNCGPAQSMLQHVRHLDRDRFTLIMACPASHEFLERYRPYVGHLAIVKGTRIPPRTLNPLRFAWYLLEAGSAVVQLMRLIRRHDVRIVHNNAEASAVGGLAAKLCGIPAVTHCRGLAVTRPAWVGRILVPFISWAYDAVIAVSGSVKEALARFTSETGRLVVIYNGVDTQSFRPLDGARSVLAEEFGRDPAGPWIGTIGGIDARKGQEYFIRAAARIRAKWPTASFFVVGPFASPAAGAGESAYGERLRRLVVESGLSDAVTFTGERDDIPQWLNAFDVVVQPSLTDAGPRVPLEAMACGRTVVATRVEGNAEEVTDGVTGLLVPPAHDVDLATAVLELLGDDDRRRALGAAARRRAEEEFAIPAQVRRVAALYERLLEARGTGP